MDSDFDFEVMGEYRVHPFASIFPLIPDSELSGLADDIGKNGLREAIVLAKPSDDSDEWLIIDGRNRYRACVQAGVKPRFNTNHMDPAKIGPWIVSHNLHRRHLTVSQRAAVAVEYERVFASEAKARHAEAVAKSNRERNSESPYKESLPDMGLGKQASDEAGDLFNVSGRSVRDAKFVADNDPELAAQVKAGGKTVSAAAKELRNKNKTEETPQQKAAKEVARIRRQGSDYAAEVLKQLTQLLEDEAS